jgi:rare lipoprotein A
VVVGAPYQIGNVTFVPSDAMNFDTVAMPRWAPEGSSISAAHHTLPVPSYAEVTDLNTGAPFWSGSNGAVRWTAPMPSN